MSTLLEAAERVVWEYDNGHWGWPLQEAITALRAALAEPTLDDAMATPEALLKAYENGWNACEAHQIGGQT